MVTVAAESLSYNAAASSPLVANTKTEAVFAPVMAKARLDEAKKKEKKAKKRKKNNNDSNNNSTKKKRKYNVQMPLERLATITKKVIANKEKAAVAANSTKKKRKYQMPLERLATIKKKAVDNKEKAAVAAAAALATAAKKAKAKANYVILKATLQTAGLVYKKTGKYVSKDLCISSPKHSININNDSFPNFYFSTKDKSAAPADLIATFPRYDGTVLVMPPKTRGSYKHYTEIGGYMQPYHGAGTGESLSNVLIGSIKALNCEVAHTALIDALKEENFTGGVLMRLCEDWKASRSSQCIYINGLLQLEIELLCCFIFQR